MNTYYSYNYGCVFTYLLFSNFQLWYLYGQQLPINTNPIIDSLNTNKDSINKSIDTNKILKDSLKIPNSSNQIINDSLKPKIDSVNTQPDHNKNNYDSVNKIYRINVPKDTNISKTDNHAKPVNILANKKLQKNPSPFSGYNSRFNSNKKYYPKGYKYSVVYDTLTGDLVTKEYMDSMEIGYSYNMSIDDYVDYKKKTIQRDIYDSTISRYDLKAAMSKGDIAKMLSQATGLTIPVPPNPVINLFGKPEININVSGEVNLRLGWRWDSQKLGTVSAFGQTQSTPIFSQDIRVNLSGSIGDKLKIATDWNTQRQFEFDNKFKIGYEGYDDDVVRLVEVGNVSLPTPSTLIGGGQALFGIRTDFQFGPLFLKAIVSQRRGERKYVNVQGGTSKLPFSIRAYDYARNHFFLDTAYKAIYREYFKYSTPVIPASASPLRVKEIEVWESSKVITDQHAREAVAFATLPPKQKGKLGDYNDALKQTPIQTGVVEKGRFNRLDSNGFHVDYNLGTLTIYNMRSDRTYAVGYRVEGATTSADDDLYFGNLANITTSGSLVLKLISVQNMQPQFRVLWDRQMKNIYSINSTNVNISDTKIGIWYINKNNDSADVLEGAADKLVTIMGVDQVNNSTGQTPADGQFDLKYPFFDAVRGEITFPSPEPFRLGLQDYFEKQGAPQYADQYVFGDIYDTTYEVARRNTARDRFVISGEVSGKSTNRISLGAFNLASGSVKVTLDGVLLTEYEDYTVDYYSGQLILKNPRATLPNANLKVEYESQDIFNISTRTLVGLRADYILYKSRQLRADIGSTFMLYDQSAVVDRVRLGEEPVSNSMFGIDGKLQWETPWLTRLLDKLPFYDTKAASSINFGGELAVTIPEPNKRRSEVASDNNEPVVYIDDFEGAQRYISLGLSPYQWYHCSPPVDSSIASSDSIRNYYRGKSFWYQYFIAKVPITSVYPNQETVQGKNNLSPLYFHFSPRDRGIYNKNPNYLDRFDEGYDDNHPFYTQDTAFGKTWGGMMRLLSSFTTNFDTENIEYIEIMMNADFYGQNTKMYVDIGQISEDVIANQILDTEDGITAAAPIPNGIIDAGEDVGIDAINDDGERSFYSFPMTKEVDPARDNYAFDFSKDDNTRVPEDFYYYNNFEGNSLVSESGQFPDKEILNPNNGLTISLSNDYFSYEVNLEKNPQTNPQIVGGGSNGWYLYRIPIRKPSRKIGNPSLSNVQYIRVWFKGEPITIAIADWRLVGSQWQRISNFQSNVSTNDSTLEVSFVNLWENSGAPDYYTMPPGVQAPKQLNNPDPSQDVRLNEQSISLSVKNLRYGEERMAVRLYRQMDIFYYKKLKFFFHGDGSMPDVSISGAVPKAYSFIRFGTDSANYYEYRRPLTRNWQDIGIELTKLTAIKQLRDTTASVLSTRQEFAAGSDDPLAIYAIKGNPILTKIQFFGLGISNPAENYPNELSTSMWVDELRLISPDDRSDWAGLASVDVKLADLGTINANINHSQPNFHKLEERFGDRISSTNWTVTMQGGLEKFAPKTFKELKLPISYTHSEYLETPEFVANNDINLEEAAQRVYISAIQSGKSVDQANAEKNELIMKSQTVKVQDSWALSGVRLGIPINYWLVKETVNKLTIGYSYSQEYERSPIYAEHFSWMWRLTTQYSNSIPEFLVIRPLKSEKETFMLSNYSDMKINFLPSNISAGLNMTRKRTTEQSRYLSYPSPIFRDFSSDRQFQFNWKFTENAFINPVLDYTINMTSTLVNLELDENGFQRSGSEVASQVFFNNGLINFGENTGNNQTVSLNIKPRLPINGIQRYLDMTGSFVTNYTWTNPLQPNPAITDIAKQASFQNQIRFNMGFRLKSLADKLFNTPPSSPFNRPPPKDTTTRSLMDNVWSNIGDFAKIIFLDFEKIDISFNQTNNSINPGVLGSTGFSNFWERGATFRNSEYGYGPSVAYQLGLVTNPHGGFSVHSSDAFPWFGFSTYPGLRPANAVLQDNFNQKSTLEAKTARPLWEGATLSLNWRSELSYNLNQTVLTDEFGYPTFSNKIAAETFSRTYLCMPSFFGIDIFNNNIDHVIALFNVRKEVINASNKDTTEKNRELLNALGESFRNGLESFAVFGGEIGKFLPAVNWSIRWEGIEKWDLWKKYVKRITVEHTYNSTYQETANTTDLGTSIDNQQVQYGFQPLIGVSVAFDDKKLDGTLTTTLRYSSTSSYMLTSTTLASISAQSTEEIQAQASYLMRGFNLDLIGLSFKNDVEVSFLATYKSNKRATYDVMGNNDKDGQKLDGNTQIVIEPRARYSVSDRVTASLYYRYEGTFNEGAAQPGFNTHQVGLDIRISIAGGR